MEEKIYQINLYWFRKHLRKIVLGFLLLIALFTSIRTVGPEEEGVVIQLGQYNRTVNPGLNFIIPFWIERMYKIPVQRQLKQEFGFRTTRAGTQTDYTKTGFGDESMMLTGDLNLTDVEWVVQYRITNSYNFLFKVRNAEKTLRDMSESVMRKVVGDRTVNEVLTVGRQEIATTVEGLLQELCDEYENGIRIDQVVLQDVNPPEPVKPSFNAVNQAQQERETLINQAEAEYNRVIPRARGEAEETIQLAEAFALNRVNRAKGEAERFNALYEAYIKAPEVTKQRIYLETMEKILPKIGNKIIVDEKGNNVLPLLNIDKAKSPQQ
ncbi:MAG TPA: FtsH protease activity modulator HflK [Algoriphagus sp.]|jgi:membrane protease subunit HflK|uniref:FtsH protease activity modulator HflK n=2 Tax=Cyclobacteriaceae TaxID=563798 RepID=UPI000C6C037C|nr:MULTISPECIES: FtsH protease activity modulator HflK [Algoriphagus]MAL13656.1 FtsH protease activity modulator HflK [Algoriphagus sp.]MAN86072.1 FtsH protease activity modulator HflK [Algoriphagus sp.]QYH39985.1 FtsH protease activity modulator HflK [Algoriphagus sp. NBT04N3]HAH37292.1 FtsH protease activity modulator HflK [Algoriphagus sp.]HAZ26533.1 FtsH protease activity modulator HflK [Algoriphagus sp.]|tara:strand:- start:5301 stop:6272 length:972 start_codon:yes stop_codon:yes gene_type:complete